MRFTVLVAADLYGEKVNLELNFTSAPTLADLFRVVETTFAVESSTLRPSGHPFVPFKVARFHVFEDKSQQWAELFNASQLIDYCQIYAFQRDATETQKQIPPARLPTAVRMAASSSAQSPTPRTPLNSHRDQQPAPSPMSVAGRGQSPHVTASPSRHSDTPRSIAGSAVPPPQFPENPTFDQKVRIVFDETDVNHNRLIELDEFRRIMRMLNVDLSGSTVADLFQRGDQDRDGVISLSDFQFFASNYPTLLDSLYFRSKEFWEDHRRRMAIEGRKQVVEECHAREHQAAQLSAEAKSELLEQEHRLREQEAALQTQLLKERDARSSNLDAKKELEKKQFDRAEREREALHGKEREQRRQAQLQDAIRMTEGTEKRVQSQEAELARAQEKEKQLEILLADARRETERHARSLNSLGEELHQVREREAQAQQLVIDAQADFRRLQELVGQADVELSTKLDRERDSEVVLGDTQRETARAAHRRDEEERALQLQRERESLHIRQHQEAVRNLEDSEKALVALENEYQEYQNRRQQVEQQELPLIEQEIRLREQRFNLEQMENRLKNEAMSFQAVTGRGAVPTIGGGRGYSPPRH